MNDKTEIRPEAGAIDVTTVGSRFEIKMSEDGKRKWHRIIGDAQWQTGDAPQEEAP